MQVKPEERFSLLLVASSYPRKGSRMKRHLHLLNGQLRRSELAQGKDLFLPVHGVRDLKDIATFDDASRGPCSAITMLLKILIQCDIM